MSKTKPEETKPSQTLSHPMWVWTLPHIHVYTTPYLDIQNNHHVSSPYMRWWTWLLILYTTNWGDMYPCYIHHKQPWAHNALNTEKGASTHSQVWLTSPRQVLIHTATTKSPTHTQYFVIVPYTQWPAVVEHTLSPFTKPRLRFP